METRHFRAVFQKRFVPNVIYSYPISGWDVTMSFAQLDAAPIGVSDSCVLGVLQTTVGDKAPNRREPWTVESQQALGAHNSERNELTDS